MDGWVIEVEVAGKVDAGDGGGELDGALVLIENISGDFSEFGALLEFVDFGVVGLNFPGFFSSVDLGYSNAFKFKIGAGEVGKSQGANVGAAEGKNGDENEAGGAKPENEGVSTNAKAADHPSPIPFETEILRP